MFHVKHFRSMMGREADRFSLAGQDVVWAGGEKRNSFRTCDYLWGASGGGWVVNSLGGPCTDVFGSALQ